MSAGAGDTPHQLVGCWAKIERAKETTAVLAGEIDAFLAQERKAYRIEGEHQDDGRRYVFKAYESPEIPSRFAVMAGEVVHHLRSSLDHLLHALIVANGGKPANNNQFPICITARSYKRACGSGVIKGISRKARAIIRSVQPFTTPNPKDTILAAVNECDILDKHRLLVVTTVVTQIGKEIRVGVDEGISASLGEGREPPAITNLGSPVPRKLSEDGVEIFSVTLEKPAPEFTASADLDLYVTFEKTGLVEFAPVAATLQKMTAGVTRTIKRFEGEFSTE